MLFNCGMLFSVSIFCSVMFSNPQIVQDLDSSFLLLASTPFDTMSMSVNCTKEFCLLFGVVCAYRRYTNTGRVISFAHSTFKLLQCQTNAKKRKMPFMECAWM